MSKESNTTPVVTTKRINGVIEPGTIIVPAEHGLDIAELRALDAVHDCTEADLALHAKQNKKPSKAATEAAAREAEEAAAEAAARAATEAAGSDASDTIG